MSQYLYDQELDFNEARADLDSVLQNIVAKANAGDDAPLASKSLLEEFENTSNSQSDRSKTLPSDVDSPRKSGSKSSRKRKKKEDAKEEKHKQNSCVMRLFERSIDLAQFSEDAPLYPICRMWMQNNPYDKKPRMSVHCDETDDNTEDGMQLVTSMPPPDRPFCNFLPNGEYQSPRIPSPVPQPADKLEDYIQNVKPAPESQTLLLNHLQHWRTVREKWITKATENEDRYSSGMGMLKEMANQHLFSSMNG